MKIIEVGRRDFLDNNKLFSLHWSVTNNCNYNCSYCGVSQKFKPYISKEDSYKIVDYINYIENSGFKVWAALFGGEPLLHPDIIEIIGKIHTTDLVAMTNLSHSLEFFKKVVCKKPDITICSTYHHERCNNIKDFKNKIEFLVKNVKLVKVKVLWDPRFKDEIFSIFKEIKQLEKDTKNFVCFLDIVYHDNYVWEKSDMDLFDYVQENKEFQIKYQSEDSSEIKVKQLSYNEVRRMFNGFPNFYRYKCETGKQGIFISPEGDVIICMSSYFAGVKPIFNLLTDDYKNFESVLKKPVLCNIDGFCCEHLIPRRRIFSKSFNIGDN